jgi:hypothetical protein
MEDQSRPDPEEYSKFLRSDDQIVEMRRAYQKRIRKETRIYLTLKFFPAIWCFENRFFEDIPQLPRFGFSLPRFKRDCTRWLDRSSWQSLLRVTEGKFKWLPFAPPIILAFSYVLEAASRLGIRFDLKWNIVLMGINIILLCILSLWLRTFCPAAVRANIASQNKKWRPLSKIDTIKRFLANTLQQELITIPLTEADLPNLNHALEENVLTHHFATTGKPWPYEGLDEPAMRVVRELGMAAVKARGGKAYERLIERRRLGEWELSERVAEYVVFRAERGPILYKAQINPLLAEVEIQGLKKDTDLAIEFSRLGRNFGLVNPDFRVEYFVDGYALFVDERSADAVLEVVSRNESCKRRGLRIAAWFLVFLTFALSLVLGIYQLWQALQRISTLLT